MPWASAIPPLRSERHFGRTLVCFAERPRNLNILFGATSARYGGRDALVAGAARTSHAELGQSASRIAAALAARGVERGDRVAILCGNEAEFAHALLGVMRLGAIAVPINIRERAPELAFILGQCGAKAVVFDAPLAERLPTRATAPALGLRFAVGEHVPGAAPFAALMDADTGMPAADPGEDETAVILYTSGTTGHPKGAMLTHLNLVHSVLHYRYCLGLDERDRSLLAVPASHVTGLAAIILAMLGVGGSIVMLRDFKAGAFLALAARERMTYTLVVPAIYNLLLREPAFERFDLAAWRLGGFGGAPMPQGTIGALAAKLPGLTLFNAYGATETTSPTTIMPPGLQPAHLDSVGQVVPCGDVRVVDGSGHEVAPGAPGELWIGGPMVVPGYWDNPAASGREFAHGYWRSGDIGSQDAQGFVRVFDRIKDLVNRGGYKIYCAEVESVLSLHPGIIESALIARPDPVLGEKSVACVVRRDPACTEDDVRAHCAQHLADYKVPDFVVFLELPLPRNANGKVLKHALREAHPQRVAALSPAAPRPDAAPD